jgi:hypothetical protein
MLTMPVKFKRFTGLLKQRYFYGSLAEDSIGVV